MLPASFSSALLLVSLLPGPPEPEAPELRELAVIGSSVYDQARVQHILRLKPGDALRRSAAAFAASLEARYHSDGYIAARVSGAFDSTSARLTLTVDEGRLGRIQTPGLDGAARERALAVLGLEPGSVVREDAILDALARLEQVSHGALRPQGDPPYQLLAGDDNVQALRLRIAKPWAGLGAGLDGPGDTPFYDRVDGFAPYAGVEATLYDHRRYEHLNIYVRGRYGFASKHGRFALGVRRALGPFELGYEFHDLSDTDDAFRASAIEEALGTLLSMSSFRDVFERRGHEAYAFARVGARAQLGVSFRSDRYASLPVTEDSSLFRQDATPRPNPAVSPGSMGSLILTARWTSAPRLFDSPAEERESFLLRSLYGAATGPERGLRVEASYEIASPSAFGGDFDFQRLLAQARGRHWLSQRSSIAARVLLAVSGGSLPPQKQLALGGLGTLRGYGFKEFSGDNMFLATAEWRHLAPFPLPSPVAFFDGGVTWTSPASSGFRSDVGLGLEWAPGGLGLRIDAAVPLDREPGGYDFRIMARLRAPF